VIAQGFNAEYWNTKVEQRLLRIGYYFDDGLHECSNSMKQALILVKSTLEAQGHTLVEFTLGTEPYQQTIREILETAWAIEGSAGLQNYIEKALQGEKPVEERVRAFQQAGMADSVKRNLINILTHLRQPRMSLVMSSTLERAPA
jgi:transposase-like protein